MFVIITAGIDLSVGFVLVLAGVVAGEFYLDHGGANASTGVVWAGALISLAVGGGWGLLQGFMVAKLKIPALIATLAGLGGAEGISYLITGGSDVRVVPNKLISSIGQGSIFGIQWLIVISFGVTLIFGLVLAYTRFGRYTYAIGSNPEAAVRAGVNADRHLMKVYALCGLLAGLAGILDPEVQHHPAGHRPRPLPRGPGRRRAGGERADRQDGDREHRHPAGGDHPAEHERPLGVQVRLREQLQLLTARPALIPDRGGDQRGAATDQRGPGWIMQLTMLVMQ